jgi:hypothetical protein
LPVVQGVLRCLAKKDPARYEDIDAQTMAVPNYEPPTNICLRSRHHADYLQGRTSEDIMASRSAPCVLCQNCTALEAGARFGAFKLRGTVFILK